MDISSSQCFLVISCIFLTIVCLKIILDSLLKTSQKSIFPPGPTTLPIIGNLHKLVSKTIPPARLQQLAKVYGPLMSFRMGEIDTVVVSSAKMAKEVLRTHDINFANRPKFLAGKVMFYDFSDIVFAPYGDYWRQARIIATLELFTVKRVQLCRAVSEEEVGRFIKCIGLEAQTESTVNLTEKIFGLLFSLISRNVFNKIGEDQAAFRELITKMSNAFSGFTMEDLYPSMTLLHPIGGMNNRLKGMVHESDRILDPIINERKSNTGQNKGEENLVDILLKFHRDNVSDTSQFSLTTDNIKGIILEIFGAGSDTSSTVIEWAMSELLKNPEAMKKAQQEVREVYQGNETIDETKVDELKYLKCVIKETFRLHPPVPLLVPRESIEQCRINGYVIPPKTRVIINAYAIGRDPSLWTDPDVFDPDRFEKSSIEYKGNDFELIPFGAGRRMCPGMTLGMANVELPLAMLLYHFNWELPFGIKAQDFDMVELFGITMRRENDLQVIPIPYSSFVM